MKSIHSILIVAILTLTLANKQTLARSLEPILWSVQNDNKLSRVIQVKLGEFLNIICPHSKEYHVLYKVSKEDYDSCSINDFNSLKTILKCDRPNENLKYTLYISSFSPVPDALEFTPGNSYYFICKLF